ncbi:hypothetical protein [Nakamurella deserti]|uniref:hypothetical protein n=1 Tax=Nakamurella deserti TaxID=2164074 RepID=UPI000DBE398E|nr:hypothetical protein [Nakamurella deserti]
MNAPRVVGLSVGGPRPAALDRLIYAIGRDAAVVNMGGHPGPVDWMLVYRSPVAVPGHVPAVWFVGDETDADQLRHPDVVLAAEQKLLDRCATSAPKVLMGPALVDHDDAKPYAPYPRDRIRRARGLPATVVGEVGADGLVWDGTVVDPKFRATVLVSASAVIADRSAVLESLAWGAPTVTDPATAAAVGAVPGEHLLIGSDVAQRRALAAGLALDMATAARLSWAGRRLFEEAFSVTHLIRRVERAAVRPTGPADRIAAVLDDLGTPARAPIRGRAAARQNLPQQRTGSLMLPSTIGEQ